MMPKSPKGSFSYSIADPKNGAERMARYEHARRQI
jgi:hypothetical protein